MPEAEFARCISDALVVSARERVGNQNFVVAIIIEIAEGATSAAMPLGYARPCCFEQLLEFSLAQIAEHHARAPRWILWKLGFHLGAAQEQVHRLGEIV
jgi:hypothetical protein